MELDNSHEEKRLEQLYSLLLPDLAKTKRFFAQDSLSACSRTMLELSELTTDTHYNIRKLQIAASQRNIFVRNISQICNKAAGYFCHLFALANFHGFTSSSHKLSTSGILLLDFFPPCEHTEV